MTVNPLPYAVHGFTQTVSMDTPPGHRAAVEGRVKRTARRVAEAHCQQADVTLVLDRWEGDVYVAAVRCANPPEETT